MTETKIEYVNKLVLGNNVLNLIHAVKQVPQLRSDALNAERALEQLRNHAYELEKEVYQANQRALNAEREHMALDRYSDQQLLTELLERAARRTP